MVIRRMSYLTQVYIGYLLFTWKFEGCGNFLLKAIFVPNTMVISMMNQLTKKNIGYLLYIVEYAG